MTRRRTPAYLPEADRQRIIALLLEYGSADTRRSSADERAELRTIAQALRAAADVVLPRTFDLDRQTPQGEAWQRFHASCWNQPHRPLQDGAQLAAILSGWADAAQDAIGNVPVKRHRRAGLPLAALELVLARRKYGLQISTTMSGDTVLELNQIAESARYRITDDAAQKAIKVAISDARRPSK